MGSQSGGLTGHSLHELPWLVESGPPLTSCVRDQSFKVVSNLIFLLVDGHPSFNELNQSESLPQMSLVDNRGRDFIFHSCIAAVWVCMGPAFQHPPSR